MGWQPGDVVVRREVWHGHPWMASHVIVVSDEPGLLATYLPEGTEFTFARHDHPLGKHPWEGRSAWEGHGVLMLQRPGESYGVWHFWDGPTRTFACWYLNLQDPLVRRRRGFDTQDLELDVVVRPDGSWAFKDAELMPERVASGRFTPGEAEGILALGDEVAAMLDAGTTWWDPAWIEWEPNPSWTAPPPPGLRSLR